MHAMLRMFQSAIGTNTNGLSYSLTRFVNRLRKLQVAQSAMTISSEINDRPPRFPLSGLPKPAAASA